ncbi:serine/threonine-protein kinase [Streptomyces sp. NBC_00140]|uniref:serine/threonine-protein kinase n=1 Tax=Streptomyces sp. NBC_00140 TaxID=2975664 RepID=UPI00224FAA1A|nr:protein kinase [Streptomyces sp. NBC_00140]MCX5332293.1 protein kinase [Streptomyces sp. NBC_00140]
MSELAGSGAEPLGEDDPRYVGPIPLIGRLGSGGMGRVYLGVHEGRFAAVKQVLPSIVGEDQKFLRRFGQELDNLAALPAGATTPLLASDPAARPPWFATAYVPGLTLGDALDAHGGPLPADALWLLLREAAKGLAAVHALDMVHRDLKPSNVMLTLDGLTLIDFGVARAAEQSQLTSTGLVVGTPAYMSPEQASGARRLTGAVDVFALGSVVAYAACGRPPFGEESGHGVLYRIVHEEPDLGPLRELDAELAEVVALCLDKDPEGRPTATELLAQFARVSVPSSWPASVAERLAERAAFAQRVPGADELPAPVRTPTLPDAPPAPAPTPAVPERRERRRRTRVALAVVPVVVVVTGTTLAIQHVPYGSDPRDEARATPTVTVSASTGPSASETSPAGKASPSPSPSRSKASDRGEKGAGSQAEGGGSGGAQDGSGGSGSGSASGGSSTSGGSSDSGSDSGSSDSGDSSSASSGSSAGSPPPALKSYRLDYTNSCVGACDMPIKVSWTAVSRATRYDIHYTNKGSNFTAKDVDTVYSTGNTGYTINGPFSGDQICVTVRAANKYGASAWAETWCGEVPY